VIKKSIAPSWLLHVLIVAGIIGSSQLAAFYFRNKAFDTGTAMLAPLIKNAKLEEKQLLTASVPKEDLQKLQTLYLVLENRKDHHRAVFLDLYRYHFASVTILLMLSALSAVVIFIVSHNGINNAPPYMKTIFFTLAALTTFYALSPVVYKQADSIDKNLKSYLQLDNLQSDVYNYAITRPVAKDTITFSQFHSSIVKKMNDINSIDLEFDYKSIPTEDFFKKQP